MNVFIGLLLQVSGQLNIHFDRRRLVNNGDAFNLCLNLRVVANHDLVA